MQLALISPENKLLDPFVTQQKINSFFFIFTEEPLNLGCIKTYISTRTVPQI